MHMCVHAYVCVVTHYHSGILEQRYTVCTLQRPLVHLSLEAKKQTFLLLFYCFLVTAQKSDGLVEVERRLEQNNLEYFVVVIRSLQC